MICFIVRMPTLGVRFGVGRRFYVDVVVQGKGQLEQHRGSRLLHHRRPKRMKRMKSTRQVVGDMRRGDRVGDERGSLRIEEEGEDMVMDDKKKKHMKGAAPVNDLDL